MSAPGPEDDPNARITAVGCVLALLTVAVIFGSALVLVRWRDPVTREALPNEVAIYGPLVIGAVFYGIASLVLKLIGLPVWTRREMDGSDQREGRATGSKG